MRIEKIRELEVFGIEVGQKKGNEKEKENKNVVVFIFVVLTFHVFLKTAKVNKRRKV